MPLFEEQVARKPNYYPWAQDFIDKMWQGHWTPNEFDFKGDYNQFHSEMDAKEKEIIVRTLSAIGQVEVAVKRFWAELGNNLPHPSMYDLGYVMANIEVIHNQAYEKLLDTLRITDVFERNLKEPVVLGRVNYLKKYNEKIFKNDKKQYIYSIVLFTLFVEYVSLFTQFYIVLWFNRNKNLLKDTAQQVQYTRNEELIHAYVGIKIINTLKSEYPQYFDQELEAKIQEEVYEAFIAESALIDWMLGDFDEEGLNAPLLKVYVKNRLNYCLEEIGMSRKFILTEDEAELLKDTYWMDEELFGNSMTDFFHKKPVDYAKANKTYNEEDIF